MGLDMYACWHDKETPEEICEFAYWRKNNNLHGWMERLYHERGNTDDFNLIRLYLDKEDLLRLKNDLVNHEITLPPQVGFFFGAQNFLDEDQLEDIQSFIAEAIQLLEEGNQIYYIAWY